MGANYEKGLYRQYEEAVALLEKMNAKMEAMEHRYQQEIAEMKAAHQAEVAKLNKALQERDERIRELTARNEALTEEVTRLKSIINNDSNNSSNPPSSDQNYDKKANNYNLRSKSGKKQIILIKDNIRSNAVRLNGRCNFHLTGNIVAGIK